MEMLSFCDDYTVNFCYIFVVTLENNKEKK
jgi:hypothetical protein